MSVKNSVIHGNSPSGYSGRFGPSLLKYIGLVVEKNAFKNVTRVAIQEMCFARSPRNSLRKIYNHC